MLLFINSIKKLLKLYYHITKNHIVYISKFPLIFLFYVQVFQNCGFEFLRKRSILMETEGKSKEDIVIIGEIVEKHC